MTTRQLVEQARKQGYKIKVYERKGKDKGIRITNINGQSFKGSTGNTYLRNIMGNTLSEAFKTHLKKITENVKVVKVNRATGKVTIKKGTWGNKKKDPVSKEIQNQIRRIRNSFKKHNNRKSVKANISIANFRYNVKTYGYEEAKKKLDEAENYSKGYAYTENVWALYMRIVQLLPLILQLQNCADYVKSVLDYNLHLTDDSIMRAREELYDLEKLVTMDIISDEDIMGYCEDIYYTLYNGTRSK